MSAEEVIQLHETIARLEAEIRMLKDEKLDLLSKITMLERERDILCHGLDGINRKEATFDELKKQNILLESKVNAIVSAISRNPGMAIENQ